MLCKCAVPTDEYHGWECTITEGACLFLIPNSKACAEKFGEGPDVVDEDSAEEKEYVVRVPFTGYCEVKVKASDIEAAKEKAFEIIDTDEHCVETETHKVICDGEVFNGLLNEIIAEEVNHGED